MKKTLAIVLLLLCGVLAFAQDTLCPPTKSYIIADGNPKDTAYLKAKCEQAGLGLGLAVLANRIPTDSRFVIPKPSKHLLRQGILHLQLPIDETQTPVRVEYEGGAQLLGLQGPWQHQMCRDTDCLCHRSYGRAMFIMP